MPIYNITITDEVTYLRTATITIKAKNEKEAREIAENMTTDLTYPASTVSGQKLGAYVELDEQEVDNSPWEIDIERVKREK